MPVATKSPVGVGLFALGTGLSASGVAVTSVITRTHRQTVSPRPLLAQVMATVRFVSWGMIPIGAVLAGALATATSPRLALLGACVIALLAPLTLLLSQIRTLPTLEDDPAITREATA